MDPKTQNDDSPNVPPVVMQPAPQQTTKSRASRIVNILYMVAALALVLLFVIGLLQVQGDSGNVGSGLMMIWAVVSFVVLTVAYAMVKLILWYSSKDSSDALNDDERRNKRKAAVALAVPGFQIALLIFGLWQVFGPSDTTSSPIAAIVLLILSQACFYPSIFAGVYAWQLLKTQYRNVGILVLSFYGIAYFIGAIIGVLNWAIH